MNPPIRAKILADWFIINESNTYISHCLNKRVPKVFVTTSFGKAQGLQGRSQATINRTIFMPMPLVSVLMPVFNGEKYLTEAINSILKQTYSNFEFLILDDGSTDKSITIVQSYKDARIRHIIAPQNSGIEKTLNKGLELAQGKYIARMDCDDISLPRRLQYQVAFMEQHPETGVLSAAIRIMKYGYAEKVRRWPITDDALKIHLLFYNPLSHPVVMMRKSAIDGFQYPFDCQYAEDYRLWTLLAQHTKFANLPDVLLRYRFHPNQVTKEKSLLSHSGARKAREAYLTDLIKNISPEEILVHHQIAENKRTLNLEDAKQWLEKLARINQEKALFSHDLFLSVLAMKWWQCCRNNKNAGVHTWRTYKASFLGNIQKNAAHHTLKYMIKWIYNDMRRVLPVTE